VEAKAKDLPIKVKTKAEDMAMRQLMNDCARLLVSEVVRERLIDHSWRN
jgi:hypothetical protein